MGLNENGYTEHERQEIAQRCIHEIKKLLPKPIVLSDGHYQKLRILRRAGEKSLDNLFADVTHEGKAFASAEAGIVGNMGGIVRASLIVMETLFRRDVQFITIDKPRFASLITWEDVYVALRMAECPDLLDEDNLIFPMLLTHMAKRCPDVNFSILPSGPSVNSEV